MGSVSIIGASIVNWDSILTSLSKAVLELFRRHAWFLEEGIDSSNFLLGLIVELYTGVLLLLLSRLSIELCKTSSDGTFQ